MQEQMGSGKPGSFFPGTIMRVAGGYLRRCPQPPPSPPSPTHICVYAFLIHALLLIHPFAFTRRLLPAVLSSCQTWQAALARLPPIPSSRLLFLFLPTWSMSFFCQREKHMHVKCPCATNAEEKQKELGLSQCRMHTFHQSFQQCANGSRLRVCNLTSLLGRGGLPRNSAF